MRWSSVIVGGILNELMQQLERSSANITCKLRNSRQPWTEVHIPQIIVETEDAQILRNREISLFHSLQHSEQELVVAGQDCRGRVGQT